LTPYGDDEKHVAVPGQEPEEGFVGPAPKYSMWKRGPYSFGPLGRISVTVVVVAFGVALAKEAGIIGTYFGEAGLALVLLFIGIFSVLAVILLWGIWQPTRVE